MRHKKALVAGVILATVLTTGIPAFASAKTRLAELRVEGPGVTLDHGTWYVTGPESARKSKPADDCERAAGHIAIAGPTPLSLVASGEVANADLSQVRVRMDEAGLFVCEIGGIVGRTFTDPDGFAGWIYYQDLVFGSAPADQLELAREDHILWVYSDFGTAEPANTGEVLEMLDVPARSDGSFTLRVREHGFDGSVDPAVGATIEGAQSVNDLGDGTYEVTVSDGFTRLRATRGLDVPSNSTKTCSLEQSSQCPKAHGRMIVGSARRDDLSGTRGFDKIDSRRGDDDIDLSQPGQDIVSCGAGEDTILLGKGDRDDQIDENCEKVKRD